MAIVQSPLGLKFAEQVLGQGIATASPSNVTPEGEKPLRRDACAYAAVPRAGVDSGHHLPTRIAMQPTAPASPIPVPKIDSDEPVAVIPLASVAPLDGPPDGERINIFAIAPKPNDSLGALRDGAVRKPFTFLLAAFSLGYVLARVLR